MNRIYTVTEEFDFDDNPSRIIYASGTQVRYILNDDARVRNIQINTGAGWQNLFNNINYRPNGPMAQAVYADGYTQTRSYDKSYRLTRIRDYSGSTTLRDISYGYESRDNLATVTDALVPANSETFGYTPRESLSSATGSYGSLGFTYDGVGNRVTSAIGATTDSYSYPAASNRLGQISLAAGGARVFTYDASGNVTAEAKVGGTHGYTYDAAGRLSEFRIGGVLQASYKYDAMGRQAIRALAGSGVTIHSVFDSQGRRIAEYDEATGALIREYVWNDWDPVAVIEGGVIHYVRTDHIGRPVFATDASGAVVWSASYLPFGGVHVTTGTPIEARFPGQWFQSESGLHQNWMRDYDPTTGRYLQADPLGLVDGASVYGYAGQNPGRYVDQTGECPWCVVLLLSAAEGVAIGYLFDLALGDGCYTLQEFATDAALGAAFGGAGFLWKGIRRDGQEFSHAVPARIMNKSRITKWIDRRKNPYRALNGNYVTKEFHAATDYHRRLKGIPADEMLNPMVRYPLRTPAWVGGGAAGGATGGAFGP